MPFEAKAKGRLSSAVKAAIDGKVQGSLTGKTPVTEFGGSSPPPGSKVASRDATDAKLLRWDEEAQSATPETYDDWEERKQKKMHAVMRSFGREALVLVAETIAPYRPFTREELAILRGAESDPVIIEAFNIFNGTIVRPL